MPALELGTVSGSDVPKRGLVRVADIAGIGAQARLVRRAMPVGRKSGAENVLVVVPTRQKQVQTADKQFLVDGLVLDRAARGFEGGEAVQQGFVHSGNLQ
jgi:hypothetical protein